jgi:asparagine synthase (glutamine-hydrolysing)
MCGIAGIFNADLSPTEIQTALARMERSLLHRGPDEGGIAVLSEPRGGLAVRRLSIVDLQHGSQPMPNEDSTVLALLNGEIYNHRALRDMLVARRHQFRGDSDTEVVVHLYEEYGLECLDRLRGMFAIAIYDTRQRRLLLARDGPGMKPLYFAQAKRGFLFASDARALFASGLMVPEPNPAAIDTYLAIGYVPAPMSAFQGLERLGAGQYLVADSAGTRREGFWQYRYQQPQPGRTDEDYSAELDTLLTDAVHSHLSADVPVGAFLSGGWDSSLTATLAARTVGRALKTFSVVFPDDSSADESRFSRLMANHLGTDHHEIEFRSSMMPDLIPKICSHLEEPCANVPAGVIYVLASLAGAHLKTVVSGEGSDELFGGYEQYRVTFPYVLRRLVPRSAARLAAMWCQHVRLRRGLRFLGAPDGRSADGEWDRLFTSEDKRRILNPRLQSGGPDLEPVLIDPDILASCQDTLQRRLSFEFTGRLGNGILLVSDKMAMAHSLEVRMPFLDRSVVEFALRLPSRLKVHGGREKVILSTLARRHLPPEIAARRKKGLAYPDGFWSRPPCDKYTRELLLDSAGPDGPLDRGYLQQYIPQWLRGGDRDAGAQISRLVFLQSWWNEFFGAQAAWARGSG